MYVEDQDYKVIIGANAFTIIQQSDEQNRQAAESAAIAEISGYLRGAYDVEQIFAATGTDRNPQVVMYTCDIALYHLVSWLPNKMGYDLRKERYYRAITWLTQVQKGIVVPDLPAVTDTGGGEITSNSFGGNKKHNYSW